MVLFQARSNFGCVPYFNLYPGDFYLFDQSSLAGPGNDHRFTAKWNPGLVEGQQTKSKNFDSSEAASWRFALEYVHMAAWTKYNTYKTKQGGSVLGFSNMFRLIKPFVVITT